MQKRGRMKERLESDMRPSEKIEKPFFFDEKYIYIFFSIRMKMLSLVLHLYLQSKIFNLRAKFPILDLCFDLLPDHFTMAM